MNALCALLLFSCLRVAAQEEGWRKPSQLKANLSLLGVGANYELRLLKYTTFNLEAGLELGLAYSSNSYSYFEDDHWGLCGRTRFFRRSKAVLWNCPPDGEREKVCSAAGESISISKAAWLGVYTTQLL